jgi:hypothetical protein
MKNTFKNTGKSILMVAMLAASLTYAKETAPAKEKNAPEKTTTLVIKNVKMGHELQIKDAEGLILYSEMIKRNGVYSKRFNLSELPDGDYIFELDKDLEIKLMPFTVKENLVVFDKALEKTIFKPYIKTVNGKIYVSKLDLDKGTTNIEIYFNNFLGNSELIYSETINDTSVIQKVVDVSAVNGTYKVVLKTNEKEFNTFITI